MRNARQIKEIVLAAFGPQMFETGRREDNPSESNADYHELAHAWSDLAEKYDQADAELIPSINKVRVTHPHLNNNNNNNKKKDTERMVLRKCWLLTVL